MAPPARPHASISAEARQMGARRARALARCLACARARMRADARVGERAASVSLPRFVSSLARAPHDHSRTDPGAPPLHGRRTAARARRRRPK